MKGEQLIGRLATGIGMGATFTQIDWARTQFRERLDIEPFPGTVNVIIDDPESMPVWVRLKTTSGVAIENPNNGPHDCDAKCWYVTIAGEIDGAILYPLVDNYPPYQVEVIAPVGVREALQIEDGESLTLTLKG